MSNNMINIVENVFENLKQSITDDDYIANISNSKRMIRPNSQYGKEICNILQHSKFQIFNMSQSIKCMILCYENCFYLLYPYDIILNKYWAYEYDEKFMEGFGLIAISQSFLIPYEGKSYEIYNNIFGSSLKEFDFKDVACFYQNYTIIKVDPEINELVYIEDIFRLTGMFFSANRIYTSHILSDKTYENLSLLLNLKSSRCIASCIIRCYDSSVLDHCFLELYRCLEFLFYIQISFDITNKYNDINLNSILNLIVNREIIKREQDTLEAVIKHIDSYPSINEFINFLLENQYFSFSQETEINKCHVIAVHIYDLRCKTAHLSYKHEYIQSDYKWITLIELLSKLVYDVYNNLDSKIIDICSTNNIWDEINI